MTFAAQLTESKKHIKASSVQTYLRNIKRLRKVFHSLPIPEKESSWLTSKKMFAWFDKQPLHVRRHLATASNTALAVYKKPSEKWKTRQKSAMTEFDDDRRKRLLTDKQKKNMPEKGFDSIKRVVSNMKRELRHILTKKNDSWTLPELLRVQELVILSLYYDYPLRLDYADLETKKTDKNCIYKQKKKPRGWHIQLTEFKTQKTLGTKIFKLNMSNQRLLNKFIPATQRLTTHGYLLSNNGAGKMTKQALSKKIMAITRKRIGRSFSVQLLRVLYAMKNRDVIETAKTVADKLLHSQTQSLSYAKKD